MIYYYIILYYIQFGRLNQWIMSYCKKKYIYILEKGEKKN